MWFISLRTLPGTGTSDPSIVETWQKWIQPRPCLASESLRQGSAVVDHALALCLAMVRCFLYAWLQQPSASYGRAL